MSLFFDHLPLVSTLTILAAAVVGCAPTEEATQSSQNRGGRLIFDELSINLSGKTAYEIVEEMAPQWLEKRGRTSIKNPEEVNVYLEGTEYGPIRSLKDFNAENVDYVEHLDSGEAQFRFGPGNTQGAIVVYLRSR